MNKIYENDLIKTIKNIKNINSIKDKVFFITGANGLIGKFIIDMLMYLNKEKNFNIKIIASARNKEKLESRFKAYLNNNLFSVWIQDINEKINCSFKIDYIINCASNTHPLQYANDPIGTILTNIIGTSNIFNFGIEKKASKIIILSSVEIYGENVNNIDRFKEEDMGYINSNTLRAGYNESKRASETLAQAYIEKYDLDISILRLPRIYGPTVKKDDSKALSQFVNNALNGEDIVLKSKGEQYFSYLYVADAVSGIFTVLINGKKCDVYYLGNIKSDIRLKDLALLIANVANTKVIFDLPSETEKKGFSKATIARLNYDKIKKELDWNPQYSIEEGIKNTINILKDEE